MKKILGILLLAGAILAAQTASAAPQNKDKSGKTTEEKAVKNKTGAKIGWKGKQGVSKYQSATDGGITRTNKGPGNKGRTVSDDWESKAKAGQKSTKAQVKSRDVK